MAEEVDMNDTGSSQAEDAVKAVIDHVGDRIEASLANITSDTSAAPVFGPPEYVGDRVIITAASVSRAGGFGFGGGGGSEPKSAEFGTGGGGGGGGSSEGRPVAVIDIGPDGVKVRPVLDFTKIGLTLLGGVFAIWRAGRKR